MVEEYRTVRQEALQSLSSQQTVLQFGLGTVGVLTGLALQLREDVTLAAVIFMGAVPLFAAFAVVMWAGEVERMVRAGAHLRAVEARVNECFSDLPLRWETELGAGGDRTVRVLNRYRAVIAVLVLIAGISAALGILSLARQRLFVSLALAALADAVIFAAIILWYLSSERRLLQMGSSPSPCPD